MELAGLDGLTLGSVVASVIASLLVLLVTALSGWATRHRLIGRIFFLSFNRFVWRFSLLAFCSTLIAVLTSKYAQTFLGKPLNAPFVGALTFAILSLFYQWKFAKMGLHAAQSSIANGTDYRAALDLCRDSFSFLGTGAFKLTSQPNFEETLLRCNNDHAPVRLLLSNPENGLIADAERKAGVAPGTYRHNIIQSLTNLKRIKQDRNVQFEVRFYRAEAARDFENFRIMLIDDDILLLSYNVYGKNADGRSTPQAVLFKSNMMSSSDNFYFAFHGYFERLWASSTSWDFEQYV
jgi:hypothetical protein